MDTGPEQQIAQARAFGLARTSDGTLVPLSPWLRRLYPEVFPEGDNDMWHDSVALRVEELVSGVCHEIMTKGGIQDQSSARVIAVNVIAAEMVGVHASLSPDGFKTMIRTLFAFAPAARDFRNDLLATAFAQARKRLLWSRVGWGALALLAGMAMLAVGAFASGAALLVEAIGRVSG